MQSILQRIQEEANKNLQRVTDWRRHIHANPELSFKEVETGKFISKILTEAGIEHQHGVADNGVVALIKGNNPESRTVALRADIDALPITEANDVPYKSKVDGVMHACGHDVHSASLLGAAQILHKVRDSFSGTVKLIFQPAEEMMPGGASIMIREGVLENPKPEAIFGQHVHPPLEVGKIGMRPGMYMASADELYLTVNGRGGHGALPQDCIDPILLISHIIVGLQQVVSRRSDPTIPTVLTIGKINSEGGNTNVIPNAVHALGTFRTMNEEWRMRAHDIMRETVAGIAKSMGGEAELRIVKGYPFLINDEEVTRAAKKYAIEYLGEENVVDLPIRMTAEDFSYYTHHAPGCFYRLGTGNPEKGITSPVHTTTFNIDEAALEWGAGLMAWMAVRRLMEEA
ncbi:MAG: amidohydrolase [Bacteroidetes bacterium]|nr:amidohydrolase [Bacteroidota bacterium]